MCIRDRSKDHVSCVLRSLPLPLIKSAIRGLRSLRSDKVATPPCAAKAEMCIRDRLTAEQIEVLKKEPDLEDIVPYKHSDSFLMDGIKFEAVYMPVSYTHLQHGISL